MKLMNFVWAVLGAAIGAAIGAMVTYSLSVAPMLRVQTSEALRQEKQITQLREAIASLERATTAFGYQNATRQQYPDVERAESARPATAISPAPDVTAPDDEAENPKAKPPPTPEQTVKYTQAGTLLEGAISARRWDESNAHQLRMMLGDLEDGHRDEILRRLSVAINEGRLRVEIDGPPL